VVEVKQVVVEVVVASGWIKVLEPATALPVSAQGYPITVGGGGVAMLLELLLVHKDLIQFFQLLRLQAEVEDHKQQELLEEVEVEVEVVMELFQVEQEIHLQ
jgi:hypothetical protein